MFHSTLLNPTHGYINGHWCPADSGLTFPVYNPATGELLAEVPQMGRSETLVAIGAAEKALGRSYALGKRKAWLQAMADLLVEHKESLGEIITRENGKPLAEAKGEVEYAAGFFRYSATQLSKLRPRTLKEHPRNHTWKVFARPAGVAGLISPWNLPLAMLAKKICAALSAGCPSVAKPAEQTPLSVVALFNLLDRVGLPKGFVNLVMGSPQEIGKALCEHPAVRVISFTGSTEVGKLLLRNTASHIKRLTLELGGHAPFIVFEDADLDQAVEHLVQNKFRAGGQTCVCANRIFVHEKIMQPFGDRIAARVAQLKVGDGMMAGVDIGPMIDRQGFEKVRRHVVDALQKGAIRLTGADPQEPGQTGCFYPPTVLSNVRADMVCTQEETFGPLIPLIAFDKEKEVIRLANETEYGLAAYVFTQDSARAKRVIEKLRFGHVGHNSATSPTPEAPFGGMKCSGLGREGGHEGIFEFIELQTVPTPDEA